MLKCYIKYNADVYLHTCTHIHTCTLICIHTHTHIHTHNTYTHAHTTHTHIHTYTHNTYTHTHMHTHRDFRLYLSPNRKIFHSHFKAVTVDGNNTEAPINVDLNEYYHGRVYGMGLGLAECRDWGRICTYDLTIQILYY